MLYTVIGRYKDNDQSYSAVVEAQDDASAVAAAQAECRKANGWTEEWFAADIAEGIESDYYPEPLTIQEVLVGDIYAGQPAPDGTLTPE